MRKIAALLLLSLSWAGAAPAATLLPLEPPLPELASLIPFAAAPLEKPALTLPEPPLPPSPLPLPPLPPPPLLLDLSQKPMAALPEPRRFPPPCIASFLGVASELLECGRSQFRKGEFDEARVSLEGVARGGDRALAREARYWLGETLLRLGQLPAAERNFLLVAQDAPGSELANYALVSLGWIGLRLNDPARARPSFGDLLKVNPGPSLIPFARHGRALALFGLTRYSEAREVWSSLLALPLPEWVRLEATFWLGETLARLGDSAGAEERLKRFTESGLAHPLLATAVLRLGWSALAAGHPLESVKAHRWFLSAFSRSPEAPWARVGLAHALLALDDWKGAWEVTAELNAAYPTHQLLLPTLLALSRWAVERKAYGDAHSVHQEMLRRELPPEVKAHVLFLDGEAFWGEGQTDAARAQYELVRSEAGGKDLGWRATLRIAQMNLREREFSRALAETQALLRQPLSPELRSAALSLSGEAAYWAKDYETATLGFSRFLSEFPGSLEAASVTMSLGWVELKQGKLEAARARWIAAARGLPAGERAGEALLLAAELAGQAGDLAEAGALLDQMLAQYPAHPQLEVALLNRANLRLREGLFEEAEAGLNDLINRSPLSPFLGRARIVHGTALLGLNRPRDAAQEFMAALQQGEEALAHLGLGATRLAQNLWDEAAQQFEEARDSGAEPVRQAALYGLAVTAFRRGSRQEFVQHATALLREAPSAPTTPRLLYLLAGLAVEENAWTSARELILGLVREHPEAEEASHALFRLGAGAGAAGQWGVAREAWELLVTRYPESPFKEDARLGLAEALLKVGNAAEARKLLEGASMPAADPRLPRALLLLAQSREATGDRAGAKQVYDRVTRDFPNSELAPHARLGAARILQQEGQWEQSRQLLEALLAESDQAASVEAAYRLGEGFRSRGDHEAALEAFMSAAYLDPASPWARKALYGAGQSFTALKDLNSAAIVYRKLLARSDVEPELAKAAKQALQRLGRSP